MSEQNNIGRKPIPGNAAPNQKGLIGSGMASGNFSLSDLVDDLKPVNPLRIRDGMAVALTLTLFIGVGISFFLGYRDSLASGHITSVPTARLIALLMLGFSTAYAAMSMARPEIGSENRLFEDRSWKVALATVALFPAFALVQFFLNMPQTSADVTGMFYPTVGRECLTYSSLSALMVGTGIVTWLRRGAVIAQQRAGWLVGMAAGGFGAAAYSVYCPINEVVYSGAWYTGAVATAAITGRLVVPRLLRW